MSIEVLEGIKLTVVEFLLSQFYLSDIVQTIGLLCLVGKLLIQIKIVKLSQSTYIEGDMLTTLNKDLAFRYQSPVGETLHQFLTKHPIKALTDVWDIEQLNVPTSHHIRNILHPVVDKTIQQTAFISAIMISDILLFVDKWFNTPSGDLFCGVILDCNRKDLF